MESKAPKPHVYVRRADDNEIDDNRSNVSKDNDDDDDDDDHDDDGVGWGGNVLPFCCV